MLETIRVLTKAETHKAIRLIGKKPDYINKRTALGCRTLKFFVYPDDALKALKKAGIPVYAHWSEPAPDTSTYLHGIPHVTLAVPLDFSVRNVKLKKKRPPKPKSREELVKAAIRHVRRMDTRDLTDFLQGVGAY